MDSAVRRNKRIKKNVLSCQYHPEAHLVEDYRAGDMVCSECGLVVGDRIVDVGSEWRSFNNEKGSTDNSRVGDAENPLLEGGNLSTQISMNGFKGKNTALASSYIAGGNQISRSVNSGDRVLINAFREIRTMADRINLPISIVERADTLFKQVNEAQGLKGRSNDSKAAACLYIACRQEGVPRTFKEICATSQVSKKEIGRSFKLILKQLETSVDLITTGDFMSRFCSNLGLSVKVQKIATCIARKAVELDLVPGRSPISVAAAAIYMACSVTPDEKKTALEIGEIAGVVEVTIKQSYKLLHAKARDLFPEDIRDTISYKNLPSP